MKKLASIFGIGVISTAVALAPAFAQQTKPMDQAGSAAVQQGPDVKATAPSPSAKPAADVKTGSAPAKTDTGVKGQKGSNVKPEANLKKGTSAKSGANAKASATPKHHVKKSVRKPGSMMHAKAHVSNPDTRKTTENSAAPVPSAGK